MYLKWQILLTMKHTPALRATPLERGFRGVFGNSMTHPVATDRDRVGSVRMASILTYMPNGELYQPPKILWYLTPHTRMFIQETRILEGSRHDGG
jgi:hypothetical protein